MGPTRSTSDRPRPRHRRCPGRQLSSPTPPIPTQVAPRRRRRPQPVHGRPVRPYGHARPEHLDMMIEVRNDVLSATQNKQRPHEDTTRSTQQSSGFAPIGRCRRRERRADAVAVRRPGGGAGRAAGRQGSRVLAVDPEQQQRERRIRPISTSIRTAPLPLGPHAHRRVEDETGRLKPRAPATRSPHLTAPGQHRAGRREVERSIGLTKQGRSRAQLALTLLVTTPAAHRRRVRRQEPRPPSLFWQTDRARDRDWLF